MWKLMSDNAITDQDKKSMSDFILSCDRLTYGKKVKEFEKAWSKWQGCKYSVFVNSGSSANLILLNAVANIYGKGLVVCQSTTWATNVAPVCQLGMPLQLCDNSLTSFGPELSCLKDIFEKMSPKFLFITHIIGMSAISEELLDLCKEYDVKIIEDCCESTGTKYNDIKVGNFGLGSTFSFYYGHHMTTIEGGMVCTNDEKVYHNLLLMRSHGMLRELPEDVIDTLSVEGVDPKFTFLDFGYNVRNQEIGAVLGLEQLDRLDDFIEIRNKNFHHFINNLPSEYKKDFNTDGISSFCLPIFCKSKELRQKVENVLNEKNIEYRPFIGGNLYRHPFMNSVNQLRIDNNSEEIHQKCIYVGNHQDVTIDMVDKLLSYISDL